MSRLLTLVLALVLAVPAVAAASGDDVLKDCGDDGKLSKRYSQSEYRDALRNIPTDVDEYTDCRDIIRDARLNAAGGGGSDSGSGAGGAGGAGGGTGGPSDATAGAGGLLTDPLADATPQEREALEKAVAGGAKPVEIDGKVIAPGELGSTGTGGSGEVPAPLAAALLLMALAAAAGATVATRRLIAARRGPDPGPA